MKWMTAFVVACALLLGGCAGLHPDHQDCMGPPSFCNLYGN
ncbi:hypothetical protein [Pararobbsia silviterrae]|nr:hypothetical protein [Pararobbsia silviterrae]